MRDVERRVIPAKIEVRAKGEGGSVATLVGYAALYDVESEDLGGFREKLAPGCFDRALAEGQDVLARAEHDSRMLLGRSSNGTLRLKADAKGLMYEVDCPDTSAGRDIAELCRRGDVRQSSFAFSVPDPKGGVTWERSADGLPLRIVSDLDLYDVAPVSSPAYLQTTVSARALEMAKAEAVTLAAEARKAEARERFNASRRPAEKRDASFEDKVAAVWDALYQLLGYPWDEEATGWGIVSTFPDSVIVEGAPGQFYSYPVTFAADNTVTLGEAVGVTPQWVPLAAEGRAVDFGKGTLAVHVERLRLESSLAGL